MSRSTASRGAVPIAAPPAPDRRRRLLLVTWLALGGCGDRLPAPVVERGPVAIAPVAPTDLERACAELARRMGERVAGQDFHVVVEPPFAVAGDGGREQVEAITARTVRWAVRTLQRDFFRKGPATPLEIWLFDGDASYRRHARELFDDTPTTPFGYFSPRHGALVMNIATGTGTLVHEIVHPFVAADFPACPAWLDEGLGSLFEQCTERDGHIEGLVNWRLDGLQEAIAAKTTVPLDALVATSREQFYGARSPLHYAMARYVLFWLQQEGTLRSFWRDSRDGAATDPTCAAALRKALGVRDLAAFQPGWERWVAALRRG